MRNALNTVISGIIIVVLVVIAIKLLGFALKIVIPLAILAFIAYVIYVLITGKRH